MENIISINKEALYIFASPSLEKVVLVFFDGNQTSHTALGVVDYKNISRTYIAHFMKHNKLNNLLTFNLDELENKEYFILAEDLEEKKDIFKIYKHKKEIIIDTPFEEAPPIPEGVNI